MTDRKIFSNYINEYAEDRTASSFARVTLKHADADTTIDPLGLAVISDDAGAFIFYENTSDISAVTSSALPDGSPVGIVVGTAEGAGMHSDITVTAAGVEVTVMFRDGTALFENIDWTVADTSGTPATGVTAALTAKQDEFTLQLEKQRVKGLTKAVAVDPKYV
jgi:hypothetical protein